MTDQFEVAYRTLVVACKSDRRWFDLDAVREREKFPDKTRTFDSRIGKRGERDDQFTPKDGQQTNNPAGAPPLDYWLLDTQAGVDRVLKSMLPERVCRVCGEPSRRIVKVEQFAERPDGSLGPKKWHAPAPESQGNSGHDQAYVRVAETLGWTDCGHDAWRAGGVLDPFDLTTREPEVGQARYIIGDVFDTLATLPDNSVDLVFSSPPFLALRSYLPADDPLKSKEIGSEATPADFLDTLLDVVEACDRVLAPHGSLCFELGDSFSGSGGAGGDYNDGGLHDGQNAFGGTAVLARDRQNAWPMPKSLCILPTLFPASLAYGYNMLRPTRTTPRWRIRNVVVWARPNPPVGALGDKFRPATSYLTVACKSDKRWFDLDAVRHAPKYGEAGTPRGDSRASQEGYTGSRKPHQRGMTDDPYTFSHPAGAPPLDYWEIPTQPYAGSHYATFPDKLVVKPVKAMCPSKVCRVCGEPSRRITRTEAEQTEAWSMQPLLAAHIKDRREALGITSNQINGWFGYKEIAKNWERTDKFGAAVPNPKDWPELKSRLSLSDEFDAFVLGERRWSESESTVDYVAVGDGTTLVGVRRDGSSYGRGGHDSPGQLHANRVAPDEWSDCGHDLWRAGVTLDPFAGSGTTLAVATGHGRDALGIDIDQRNAELALERVGPLFLQVETLGGTEPFRPPPEDVITDAV